MDATGREPRYQIGVAASMLNCHPQTLRLYEREGLVEPHRTDSGFRLYCDDDIARLRHVQSLTQDLGVNLAGVHVILNLLEQMEKLTGEVIRLRRDLNEGPKALGPGVIRRRRRRTVRIEIQGSDDA